ncbi:DUF6350 family protein [Bifidobacterium sp. ESL0704]|uniref:cell division protein PerM n=1 Tax=Bifidobacterium sp. ESL0704 TaxID=2983219 RepID=UPI0023F8C8C4|nr:DUF6350 family protein [Bifidobacterium sp. ESL0704]WEV52250.1 DUF6350 family protein [Bifidobacterium sp. ESL0704]
MSTHQRPWFKGILIALGASVIFTVCLGFFMALTLLVVSMEEGGGTLSNDSVPLTLAIVLLSQGAGFRAGAITLSVVPLLLTVLLIWLIAWLTKVLSRSLQAYVSGILLWTAIMWVFAQNVAVILQDPVWLVMLKTAMVFSVGFLCGALPQSQTMKRCVKFVRDSVSDRLALSLKLGFANTAVLLLGYFAIGLVTLIVWVVTNQSAMLRVFHMANMQTGSRILTTICTLAWLPNLCLWALSWLFGSGFAIGDLASFTLWNDHAAGLPAVPVFAIFPQAVSNDMLRIGFISIPLVCGFLIGVIELFLPRCFAIGAGKPDEPVNVGKIIVQFLYPMLSFFLTSALMSLCVNVLFGLSSGALGQHRLAHVGVDSAASSRVVCLPSALGFSAAWLLSVVVVALVFAMRLFFGYLRAQGKMGANETHGSHGDTDNDAFVPDVSNSSVSSSATGLAPEDETEIP